MSKKPEKYTLDYFLSNESFIDWAKGDKSLEKHWIKWLEAHPEASEVLNEAYIIAKEIKIKSEEISKNWIDQIKDKIDTSIDDPINIPDISIYHAERESRFKWISYAASVILIIAVSVFTYYQSQSSNLYSKQTQKGQKLTFYLNDGTKVKLNSVSSLQYADFTDSSRTVFLTGEAYFDVVRDSLRPFTVITDKIETRVLGTSFNINAYSTEAVSVALISGQVEVTDGEDKLLLYPGQVALSGKKSKIGLVEKDISRITSWKDGIITFDRATRQEVLDELSRWYGVKFIVQGAELKNADWKYTGSFDDQSLQVILMSLSYVKKFDFEIKSDSIYINY